MFVAIDDYSRELFAGIMPDKSQHSAAKFLNQVLTECAYKIECTYSDNGTEYKGKSDHAFVSICSVNGISQRLTRPKRPQTNGKAERVIRTLLEMWYEREKFADRSERKRSLIRFVNYYNTVKPHKGIDGRTPFEQLIVLGYAMSKERSDSAKRMPPYGAAHIFFLMICCNYSPLIFVNNAAKSNT